VIEASLDVCVEDVFVLLAGGSKDGLDRIVRRAARAEAVAIWLKSRFPLRLEGQFDEGLVCPIEHGGDIDSTLPHLPRRLRDLSPSPTRITHCAASVCGSSVFAAALTPI